MAITTSICSSSPTIFSTIPSLKSLHSLQHPPSSSLSLSPPSPSCKFGVNLVSSEALSIAAATEAVELANAAVQAAREAVALASGTREVLFDGGSDNGVESGGLEVRRKKRRKRRKELEFFGVEEERNGQCQRVLFESVNSGCLSPIEEAEFCLCLKERAKIEAARRRIVEAQQHEPTTKQLSKVLRMKKNGVEKILYEGRESVERITHSYRRLVVSIATTYQGKGLSLQDLIQEGSIGLLRGAERFDPERGCKLSTYVYWWIKEAIITAISNKGRIVRLPGSTWDMVAKIGKAKNALRHRLRRWPSYDEIAKVINVQVPKVRLNLERSRAPVSLDQGVTDQGRMTLQEIIPGPDETMPENMVKKQLMKQTLEKLLKTLSEREALILRLSFGLNGQIPLSCEEIGRLLKLSRERIRQINVAALSKLQRTSFIKKLKVYVA